MQRNLQPSLAFTVLEEIAWKHSAQQHIPDEALLDLHSLFGDVLVKATELLENCSITRYETEDGCRKIYKVGNKLERYTIYNDINFCQCPYFQCRVLESGDSPTCKHVLALKLNQITKSRNVKVEQVTNSQFVEFLNEQLNSMEDG